MLRISISDNFTMRKLIRFSLPSIVMVIFTSLYGIVDGLFVSNTVGDDAFAAINLFFPLFYLLGAVGFLLGSGGCALIAKLFGEGKDGDARRCFCGLTVLVTAISAAASVLTAVFADEIAIALGATGAVREHCKTYAIVMLSGLVPFTLQTFFQYYFAVADRPKIGLVITVAAGATNILGDFLLIYVAKLGVVGAAAATVAGECVGGIVPLIYFLFKKGKRLYFERPKLELKQLLHICVNGSSELLASVSNSLVNMMYNFQLLRYIGSDGVVAFGVIMYVSFIFIGCYLGFSVGTTPIIGYNYGAQNSAELKNVYKKSFIFIAATSVAMAALAEALARPLSAVFVSYDAELLNLSAHALRLFSISFLLSGFNIYASAFFTALNNGMVSAIISVSRTLFFQVGAVYILPLVLGLNGIWCATILAEALALAVSVSFIAAKGKKYGYRTERKASGAQDIV